MRRSVSLIAALALVAAACGGESGESTSTTVVEFDDPRTVVQDLVEALIDEDWSGTEGLADERHIAFLTAIERGSSREVASMLRAGIPSEVRVDFWSSFALSLPTYTGESITRIQVGSVTDQFVVDGNEYVAVDMFVADSKAEWILRLTDEGWVLDLIATFGTGFLPNLRAWFAFIGTSGDAAYIRDEFESEMPSLMAGLDRLPLGPLPDNAREAADELIQDFTG